MTYYVEWPCTHADGSLWAVGFPACKTLKEVAFVANKKVEVWGECWAAAGKTMHKYLTICKWKAGKPELVGYYELVEGKLKKAGTLKLTEDTVV